MHCAQCTMLNALCIMHSLGTIVCTMHYALTRQRGGSTIHCGEGLQCIVCTVLYALCTMLYALCTMQYALTMHHCMHYALCTSMYKGTH
jgi:hypothetical protein